MMRFSSRNPGTHDIYRKQRKLPLGCSAQIRTSQAFCPSRSGMNLRPFESSYGQLSLVVPKSIVFPQHVIFPQTHELKNCTSTRYLKFLDIVLRRGPKFATKSALLIAFGMLQRETFHVQLCSWVHVLSSVLGALP